MKKLIAVLGLGISMLVNASSIEEATALYASRASDSTSALNAAIMFKELAKTRTSNRAKAQMKNSQVDALNYYAENILEDNEEKELIFEKAYTVANSAVENMKGANSPEDKKILAESLYNYCVSLANWAKTKGITTYLGKWGELRDKSYEVLRLDDSVSHYGALSFLGNALLRLPVLAGGDKIKGYVFLLVAYEKSQIEVNGITATSNISTLTSLVWAAKELEKIEDFCTYYEDVTLLKEDIDIDSTLLESHFPSLVPETVKELKKTVEDADFQKFHKKNC